MTIWRMRNACWIPKATIEHSEYVIVIAFPLQQWLQERAQCYAVVHCLSCHILHFGIPGCQGSIQELVTKCLIFLTCYALPLLGTVTVTIIISEYDLKSWFRSLFLLDKIHIPGWLVTDVSRQRGCPIFESILQYHVGWVLVAAAGRKVVKYELDSLGRKWVFPDFF